MLNFGAKRVGFGFLGLIFVIFTILLVGCGPYEFNYGTYEYYGVRITDADNNNMDASASETTAKFSYPMDVVFNTDNTATITTYSTTYNLTYTVNGSGFVTFSGDSLENLTSRVNGNFNNHGYFEDDKFFFRYKFDADTKEAYYTICVLDPNSIPASTDTNI